MNIIKRIAAVIFAAALILSSFALPVGVSADSPAPEASGLRRVVSPEQPMWIVHIDSWNDADPEKIIDLIPEDIRPYVVFNISMSISWDEDQQRFTRVEYGYETAKSWLRACAEKGVWAMIQPASGGPSHFPDYDPAVTDYEDTIYGEFFRDYPNFLGFNYCEQFWGFENYVKGFPITPEERYKHFAGLLELCNKYGGYLVVSWCGNQWSPSINPLAMIKRIPEFEEAARLYSENFILLEKYTQTGYLSDMESLVLGTYLSGYCGNFGIRYDSSGWTDESGQGTGGYTLATGLTVHLERMILNGATVIDAPELTWVDDFYETAASVDKKGYSSREWETTLQFKNVFVDMYRKIIEGSFRIPSREEVIKRTKLIIVNDVETGNDDAKYSIPANLTEGLYRMEGDGNLENNHSFYKSTGRYPTIPETAGFADPDLEKQFEKIIYKSEYNDVWPTVDDKVAEMDSMFAQEYTGDVYAGRYLNTWITYNPYKRTQTAKSTLNLQYNTADTISLEFPRYSVGMISEFEDHLDIYLNNYNPDVIAPKEDIVSIGGASEKPSFELTDRGDGALKPEVAEDWTNGVYTLTVKHNGPVDIRVNCSGSGTGKLTELSEAALTLPADPPIYNGELQHEGECFDTLDVEQVVKNGAGGNVREYRGQGYLIMGLADGARARDTVKVNDTGTYMLTVRCRAGGGSFDVYTSGHKSTSVELEDTAGSWSSYPVTVKLKKGENDIEFRLNGELPSKLYIDCFTLSLVSAGGGSGGFVIVAAVIAALCVIGAIVALVLVKKSKHS